MYKKKEKKDGSALTAHSSSSVLVREYRPEDGSSSTLQVRPCPKGLPIEKSTGKYALELHEALSPIVFSCC